MPRIRLAVTSNNGEANVWRDYYTKAELGNFTKPWKKGHENDHRVRHNLYLDTKQPLFNSWDQGWNKDIDMGCLCEAAPKYDPQIDHPPLLVLWGVEQCSALRSMDYLAGLKYTSKQSPIDPKDLFFVSGMSMQIHYNSSAKSWTISDAVSKVRAETKTSKESFALGKKLWTVTGDNLDCHDGKPYNIELKLTGCKRGEDFTCDDGQCILLNQRCDTIPDCRDKSDEKGCNILVLEDGYNKRIPPITPKGSTIVPAICDVSIVLSKVVHIDEEDHAIEFQFEIILEWNENRVTYRNLKHEASLNVLNDTEMRNIWLPQIIYENTDDKESTRLGTEWEWETDVLVERIGNGSMGSYQDGWLDETLIFLGAENILMMSQTYTHEFQCVYQLANYPFDTQVISGSSISNVRVIPLFFKT